MKRFFTALLVCFCAVFVVCAEVKTITIEFKTGEGKANDVSADVTLPQDFVKSGAEYISDIKIATNVRDFSKYGARIGKPSGEGELEIKFSGKVTSYMLSQMDVYVVSSVDNGKMTINGMETKCVNSKEVYTVSLVGNKEYKRITTLNIKTYEADKLYAYLSKIVISYDDSVIDHDLEPSEPAIYSHEVSYDAAGMTLCDVLDGDVVVFESKCADSFTYTVGDDIEPTTVSAINNRFEYTPSISELGSTEKLTVYSENANGKSEVMTAELKVIAPEKPAPVTFSHPSGEIVSGTAVTLSGDKFMRYIKYSFDNTNWQQYIEPIVVDEACTIYAIAYNNIDEASEPASVSYTVIEPTRYALINDMSQLVDATYVVMSLTQDGAPAAMGKLSNKFKTVTEGIAIKNNLLEVAPGTVVQQFTINKTKSGYTFQFPDTEKYLALTSENSTYYTSQRSGSYFTISLNDNNSAYIINKDNTDKCMQFSKRDLDFGNYTKIEGSTKTRELVYLYRLVDDNYVAAPESSVLYMHGVYSDRVYDFTNPVELSKDEISGIYRANSVYIGNEATNELGFFFSTDRAEYDETPEATSDWSQLGTIYHSNGWSTAISEGVTPYTVDARGYYDIEVDFSGFSPLVSATPADVTTSASLITTSTTVEYYNLQGLRVTTPERGIYLRREGSKVTKVYVR